MKPIGIDERLIDAIVDSTHAGLQMGGLKARPVGYSLLPARAQEIAAVVGLVGRRNGTVRMNLSKRGALFVANRFTGSESVEIDDETLDAIGEITNIIAGRLKAELPEEDYGLSNISCPSIIVGADYHVYHFRGFTTVAVEFELEGISAILLTERLFSTTVSLSGK